jgi:hypothetical protein
MKPKLLLCLALVLSGGWFGCSKPAQIATNSASKSHSKNVPLDFLADIPSLNDVSLKMSEAELLEITRQQKLDYTHGTEHGDSMYYVHPKEHVVVIITFRQGHCDGIQRLPD